jgi:uncharacterized protein (UPF0332 family)
MLAQHRLARARETLADGHVLLAADRYASAVNRFYYAAFHAARALLATRGLDSSRHSGVIALFQQHFVKTGVVSADVARALPRAFEKRLNADYEDFSETTSEEASRVQRDCEQFVAAWAAALEPPPPA